MHRMLNHSKTESGPETAGLTIHWAWEYDLFTSLLGLGVHGANSRMVVEMAQIKSSDKVLDVGCGTGNLTLTAQKYVGPSGSVYGIDASPEMIEVARKKAKRNNAATMFEIGLIEKIPFPEATFDDVVNRLMIHHLPGDLKRKGIAEIFRVLKPGGRLFIADFMPPSNPFLAHILFPFVGHRMMRFDVGVIPPILTEVGFGDVASGKTHSMILGFVSGKKPDA